MRISKITSTRKETHITNMASNSSGVLSIKSLVYATKETLEVSKLAMEIISQLDPSNKNKFLDYYDSGDSQKASKLCSTITNNPKSGLEIIVNLVYKCLRKDLEEQGSQHINTPVEAKGRGSAVPAPIKTRVKNQLHDICKKTWQSIPLDEILWTLKKNGLMALQEDNTEWSGMLMGTKECGDPEANSQRVSWPVAMQSPSDPNQWVMTNTAIQLSWCVRRYDPMTFEIVVYMG